MIGLPETQHFPLVVDDDVASQPHCCVSCFPFAAFCAQISESSSIYTNEHLNLALYGSRLWVLN